MIELEIRFSKLKISPNKLILIIEESISVWEKLIYDRYMLEKIDKFLKTL